MRFCTCLLLLRQLLNCVHASAKNYNCQVNSVFGRTEKYFFYLLDLLFAARVIKIGQVPLNK